MNEWACENKDKQISTVDLSFNPSMEQEQKRMFEMGMAEKSSFLLQDYRDEKGLYDGVVSIEMFEAVGKDYWNVFFNKIESILNPNGNIGLQLITIDDKIYDVYKNNPDFIQKYIFPGGFLPNKNSINKYISDNGLTIKSYESYADHYSNTLSIWRDEFNKKWDQIKNQGFDLTFKRMWEFYLCYCEAGFKSKNIDLIQFSIQNK